MFTTLRRVVVFSVFSLLFVATSAAAECAWVLWSEWTLSNSDGGGKRESLWTPKRGFETKGDCDGMLAKELATTGPSDSGVERLVFDQTVVVRRPGAGTLTTSFRCLPDTVDPREAKAK